MALATQVKRRRGTTAENDAFTGAEGEIVVDTEKHELRVHDGVTQGGFVVGGGGGVRLIASQLNQRIDLYKRYQPLVRVPAGYNGVIRVIGYKFLEQVDLLIYIQNGKVVSGMATSGILNMENLYVANSMNGIISIGYLTGVIVELGALTVIHESSVTPAFNESEPTTNSRSVMVNDLNRVVTLIAYQTPTADNSYTWYRKYSNGWVEQGGQVVGSKTVSFPVVMANTNYFTLINSLYDNSGPATWFDLGYIATKLVTGMTKGGNAATYNWFVAGIAA